MTRDDRKYARFYYPEFIRDYPAVYADDAAFATWMRLLVIGEQMWPMPVELPRSVRPRALRLLIEAGLVATDGTNFALKGLDAERSRRRDTARNAAAQRWDSGRNADAVPSTSTSTSTNDSPPPQVGRRKNGTNPRAQGTNPRASGTSIRQEREGRKRQPVSLHDILKAANAGGSAGGEA